MDLLEELLAEREIRKLVARYARFADDGQVDDWVNLFTDDGEMVCGTRRLQGRDALRTWISQVLTGPRLRHLMTNADITIETPTSATVVVDMALLRAKGEHWQLMASPRYTDQVVQTADGWKFRERVIDQRTH